MNYSLWKIQMAVVLESYDLAEFVTTGVLRPSPAAHPHDALMWDKLNAWVRSFIFLNCQPAVLNHIKQISSAHAISEFLDCQPTVLNHIKQISSARAIWEFLDTASPP